MGGAAFGERVAGSAAEVRVADGGGGNDVPVGPLGVLVGAAEVARQEIDKTPVRITATLNKSLVVRRFIVLITSCNWLCYAR